eukprot:jgi/Picsp_1/36/NSC_00036-R1_protein
MSIASIENRARRGEFFGCYLLRSLHPTGKGRTYIGFTVNPERRLRQHNGELTNGAWRTKRWRPWEMVMLVYGFVNQTTALQFEWTWQHPDQSLDVKDAVKKLGRKSMYGVKGKVLMLMSILNSSPWKYFPLKIRFLSGENARLQEGVLSPPRHMEITVGPLCDARQWVCSSAVSAQGEGASQQNDDISSILCAENSGIEVESTGDAKKRGNTKCVACGEAARRTWSCCPYCSCRTHVGCLAEHYLLSLDKSIKASSTKQEYVFDCLLPDKGECPECGTARTWNAVLETLQNAGWKKRTRAASAATASPANHKMSSPENYDEVKTGRRKKRAATGSNALSKQKKTASVSLQFIPEEKDGEDDIYSGDRSIWSNEYKSNTEIDDLNNATALSSASNAVSSLLKDSLEDADSLASRMLHRLHSRVVDAAKDKDEPSVHEIEQAADSENMIQYSMCVSNDAQLDTLQEVSSCCSDSASLQAIDLRTPEQEGAASHDGFNDTDSVFSHRTKPADDVDTGTRDQEVIILLT